MKKIQRALSTYLPYLLSERKNKIILMIIELLCEESFELINIALAHLDQFNQSIRFYSVSQAPTFFLFIVF